MSRLLNCSLFSPPQMLGRHQQHHARIRSGPCRREGSLLERQVEAIAPLLNSQLAFLVLRQARHIVTGLLVVHDGEHLVRFGQGFHGQRDRFRAGQFASVNGFQ